MLLLLIIFCLFSIPAIQTGAAKRLTKKLNENFDTEISIDKIRITYDARIKAKGVYIGDHHGDTLISSESLKTNLINLRSLVRGEKINFGDVTARHLTFRLRRYEGEDKDSFGIFLDKLESEHPDENKGPQIIFTHLTVIDSKFSFDDYEAKYSQIIDLDNLNIDASDFIIDGGDISLKINSLNGEEKRGVVVENLTTEFLLNEDSMNFDHFNLETKHSHILGKVHFSYEETMANFENTVKLNADFEESTVATSDLRYYYDEFGSGHDLVFHGKMQGVLNDFVLHDFVLKGINQTSIAGEVGIKNIFEEEGFWIGGDFKSLETNYFDLINLLPGILEPTLPKDLIRLGQTKLTGKLSTTGYEVITNSHIVSQIGRADLNAGLYNLQSNGNETYEGAVTINGFHLGKFLNNPELGRADFTLNLKGKGLVQKDLNAELKGVFNNLEFNGYTYRNITVNGQLKNPIFTGEVISEDPNLQMHFNGSADVSGEKNNYDFTADVAYVDFYALNFNQRDSVAIFKGLVKMDLDGHHLDDIVGNIQLINGSYQNKKDIYEFDELTLTSAFEGDVRKLVVTSPDVIDGEVSGRFLIGDVGKLFRNAIGNLYTNYRSFKIREKQYIKFDIAIHSKVVQALFPDITLSPGTKIKGEVHESNSNVKLAFNSPEIKIYDNKLMNVNLQLDNTNPLFATYFDIDSVATPYYNFSKTNIVSNRRNDTLYVRTDFKGGKENKDQYNVNLFYTINKEGKSVVGVRPSDVTFRENTWYLAEDGKNPTIVLDNSFRNIKTDTIYMSHNHQKISFIGSKTGKNHKHLQLNFTDVDLDKITPSIENFDFKGLINGELEVNQQQGNYYPSSNIHIADLEVNELEYGNLDLNIEGNQSLTAYAIQANLTKDGVDFMTAQGEIDVDENNPRIDVDMELQEFKIGILNAFGEDVIDKVRGMAFGEAKISGNYKRPTIQGKLRLRDAGLSIPYLNVDMAFQQDAPVILKNQEFYFDEIQFEDSKYHTEGIVNGSITHHNFREWGMDLELLAPERLLVLDTQYTEESLYYGQAYISGAARIHGSFEELIIDVEASSEKGTNFKIPLSDAESLAESNFIYFMTPEDKEARKKGEEFIIKKLKGLQLNFDLDINEKADIEIVIDQKSGSALKGKGAGTILMEINTNGKFNMWGDFVVYKGIYNFKYGGLIEKDFEVVPGGSITWDGNPVQANLNVRALYETEANPATILENPTINRPIPVNVYIELTNLLTNVDINFELQYPNLSSVVKSELEYRINDRETTELQALSLIAQRSFYSDMGMGRNAHPENILYERAAGLFNDIFSGEEDIFKVGVNYTKGNRTPDQDYSDRVGVTLSTHVNERIIINGKVGVPVGGYTRSVVVGDVEMEFLLNEEGTLRAKLFNRESDIQYIGEELGYTQGIGLTYSVDFSTFKELISKILNKQINIADLPGRIEEEEEDSLVPDYIRFPSN